MLFVCSIRTRRVTRVPVTHVNTRARVPMCLCLMLSTRVLAQLCLSASSVKVSSVAWLYCVPMLIYVAKIMRE